MHPLLAQWKSKVFSIYTPEPSIESDRLSSVVGCKCFNKKYKFKYKLFSFEHKNNNKIKYKLISLKCKCKKK